MRVDDSRQLDLSGVQLATQNRCDSVDVASIEILHPRAITVTEVSHRTLTSPIFHIIQAEVGRLLSDAILSPCTNRLVDE